MREGEGVTEGATKRVIHSNKIKLVSFVQYTQDGIMVCAHMHGMYTESTYVHMEQTNREQEYVWYIMMSTYSTCMLHICRPGTAASSLCEA